MSAFSAYRIFARVLLIVSWLCAALLQFRQDASLARSGSFPIRQLTVRRWAAGDYGHNIGNALFSSSVRTVFRYRAFYLRAHKGAIMALFLHVLFSGGILNTPSDLQKS